MKKALLIFVFSIFHFTMFSQIPYILEYLRYSDTDIDRQTIHGSIYLDNQFVPGMIEDTKKGNSQAAFLRYNLLDDIVEIKLTQNSKIRFLPRLENIVYDFGDYSLVLKNINEDPEHKTYYLEYYTSNDLTFIGKPVLAAREMENNFYGGKNIEVFQDYKFYLLKDNDQKEIGLRTKELRKLFAGNTKAENYLKVHKVNNVDKMQKFLKYYHD